MEDILDKLLASDLLNEETKTEISEAWLEAVEAKKAELREEVALEVRSELAEQFVVAREALVDKVDTFISEQLAKEMGELRSDIERFRDLEAEYAGKLVEEKRKLAEEVEQELDHLVDKIDSFLDLRLAEELTEMKDDLEIVKQNEFGRKVFEAFANEYAKSYVDEDSVQAQLAIAESKLVDAEKRMQEIETEKNDLLREQKMAEVLKPLTGAKREQMAFVLQNVETTKLEEAYSQFIGRILKEDNTKEPIVEQAAKKETKLATGDVQPIVESAPAASDSDLEFLKKIAGIKS